MAFCSLPHWDADRQPHRRRFLKVPSSLSSRGKDKPFVPPRVLGACFMSAGSHLLKACQPAKRGLGAGWDEEWLPSFSRANFRGGMEGRGGGCVNIRHDGQCDWKKEEKNGQEHIRRHPLSPQSVPQTPLLPGYRMASPAAQASCLLRLLHPRSSGPAV